MAHGRKQPAVDLIVVCGTQRCGSTMVCEDLHLTGVLGRPEEYFLILDPTKGDVSQQDFAMLKKELDRQRIFGVKLMGNQFVAPISG